MSRTEQLTASQAYSKGIGFLKDYAERCLASRDFDLVTFRETATLILEEFGEHFPEEEHEQDRADLYRDIENMGIEVVLDPRFTGAQAR